MNARTPYSRTAISPEATRGRSISREEPIHEFATNKQMPAPRHSCIRDLIRGRQGPQPPH